MFEAEPFFVEGTVNSFVADNSFVDRFLVGGKID